MKKLIFLTLLIICALPLKAQAKKTDVLESLEGNKPANQNVTTTATLKSSSRLFGIKDDLTSVILIIPADSVVTVLDSDSTYLHVVFEDTEGYIYKQHAIINKTSVVISQNVQAKPTTQEAQPVQEQQQSRFSYLENKYGSNMAARLVAGKIWKGMNSEMVHDSWGSPGKINRVINGNIIKEEWIYINTWLYFENNALVEWGPINN